MNRFNEIKVGDTAELTHIITKKDVENFVNLTGDDNKLHVDPEYASKTSFIKPVAHGMLGASFISTIIGTKLPGDGALWFSQSLEFLLPVRIGDKIKVRAEVINKFKRDEIVELKTDIFNQNKQKVTSGTAKVKIIGHEKPVKEMKFKQHKKTALVIGGSGGIGRAVCVQLAKDGFDVAVHYNTNEKTALLVKKEIEKIGRKAIVVKADITNNAETGELADNVLRKFGSVAVMVNCTTVKLSNVSISDLEWEDINRHLELSIKGSYNLVKSLLPGMEKLKNGKIINISTQYIENTPPVQLLPYITAKSALYGFSKALAVELAPLGITVNMVSPGMTETELISFVPEKIRLLTMAKTPLRKLAKPQDVAGAVSFLASEKADYITGETIRVNGGQVMA